jgi:hypothetical protein
MAILHTGKKLLKILLLMKSGHFEVSFPVHNNVEVLSMTLRSTF